MDNTLSVYFNTDKTYISLVERSENGLKLQYINSTNSRIELENMNDDESIKGIEEFNAILNELEGKYQRISVTLPSESTFITQFPGKEGMKRSELEQMVNLEISQIYPQYNMKEFSITIVPFVQSKNKRQNMLAVIISRQIIKNSNGLFQEFGFDIDNLEISQLNAHSAFLYNYPELHKDNIALISIQDNFIDISVLKNSKPVYYNLVTLPENNEISEVFEKEFNKITSNFVDEVNKVFFFGSGLTKDLNMACWETSMMLGLEAKRLNPFRYLKTGLDKRDKDYCSRVFHLYPPLIGGCIPPIHERIKLA